MHEDLITNSFIDGVNRTIVKRNVVLAKTAFILWTIYCLVHLWDWYSLLKVLTFDPKDRSMIYYYRILPVLDVVLLGLNTYGYVLIVKGYRSINASFERPDPTLLGLGFKYFYTANILLVISIVMSIMSGLLKYFFLK